MVEWFWCQRSINFSLLGLAQAGMDHIEAWRLTLKHSLACQEVKGYVKNGANLDAQDHILACFVGMTLQDVVVERCLHESCETQVVIFVSGMTQIVSILSNCLSFFVLGAQAL